MVNGRQETRDSTTLFILQGDKLLVQTLPPPYTDAFFMRCVAIRHNASMHIRGYIVTERTGTDEKRIRVGRALITIGFLSTL